MTTKAMSVTLGPLRGPSERSTRPGGPFHGLFLIMGSNGDEVTMRMFLDGVVEITRLATSTSSRLASCGGPRRRTVTAELLGT